AHEHPVPLLSARRVSGAARGGHRWGPAGALLGGPRNLRRRLGRVHPFERVSFSHAPSAADRAEAQQALAAGGHADHVAHVVRSVRAPVRRFRDAAIRHRHAAGGGIPWVTKSRKTPVTSWRRTSWSRRS